MFIKLTTREHLNSTRHAWVGCIATQICANWWRSPTRVCKDGDALIHDFHVRLWFPPSHHPPAFVIYLIYIYILILILVILIHSLEWRKDLSCRAVDPSKLASIPWWSPVTTLCHIIEQQLQIKSSYMSCLMIICLNTSNLQKDQKSFSPIFS